MEAKPSPPVAFNRSTQSPPDSPTQRSSSFHPPNSSTPFEAKAAISRLSLDSQEPQSGRSTPKSLGDAGSAPCSPHGQRRKVESALSAQLNATAKLNPSSKEGTPEPAVPSDSAPLKRITQAELVHTFEGHTGGLLNMTVHPDCTALYTGGEDRAIMVWSIGTAGFALRHSLNDAHGGWVWHLIVSPNGQILYSGSGDRTIRMWDIGNKSEPPKPSHLLTGHEESVCSLAMSADSCFLYSGSDDKTIKVWDVSAGLAAPPQLLQTLTGHTGYVTSMALSQDGLTLFSAGMSGDTSIKVWRACGIRNTEAESTSSSSSPSAASTPYKPPTCKLLNTLNGHTQGIYSITLSPDGKLMYSGSEDKSILVWTIDSKAGTGSLLRTLEGAHDRWVRSLRLTPDGRTLISGSADTTIGLWDMDAQGGAQLLQVLRRHTDRVRCIRLSSDGRYLFSASSDRTVRCWLLK